MIHCNNSKVSHWNHFIDFRFGIVYDATYIDMIGQIRDQFGNTTIAVYFYDSSKTVREIRRGLIDFAEKDVKIFVTYVYENHAKLICAAQKLGLFSPGYVWFIEEWTWTVTREKLMAYCTTDQLHHLKMSEGLFAVAPNAVSIANRSTDVGFENSEQFFDKVQERIDLLRLNSSWNPTYWDLYAYDLVWVAARSARYIQAAEPRERLENFFESVDRMDFYGVSGYVAFEGVDTASPQMALYQLRRFETHHWIAQFSATSYEIHEPVQWILGKVPLDYTPQIETKIRRINEYLAIIYDSLALTSTLLILLAATINFWKRETPLIKLTSPLLNYVILSGAFFLILAILALSVGSIQTGETPMLISCYARKICLSFGFSMGFGALFAKTWRVYRVFARLGPQKLEIPDWKLLLIVVALLVIDCVVLSAWFTLYPLQVVIKNMDIEETRISEFKVSQIQWQNQVCSHSKVHMYFHYLLFFEKGLLLIFGGFLSFETRNVHVKEMNDSKAIAISIYNVVVCCLFAFISVFLFANDETTSFAIAGGILLFCTVFSSSFQASVGPICWKSCHQKERHPKSYYLWRPKKRFRWICWDTYQIIKQFWYQKSTHPVWQNFEWIYRTWYKVRSVIIFNSIL